MSVAESEMKIRALAPWFVKMRGITVIVNGENTIMGEPESVLVTPLRPMRTPVKEVPVPDANVFEPSRAVNLRAIPGFPGYFASDQGIIYSQWQKRGLGTGRGSTYIIGCNLKPLRTSHNHRGYPQAKMSRNGKQFTRRVNRLILETFVGPCPLRHEACHENRIRTDNRLSNLRWDTPRANQADRVRHGTSNRGERHPQVRLTESQVLEIRRRFEANEFPRDLAATFRISVDHVRSIGNRKAWGWL